MEAFTLNTLLIVLFILANAGYVICTLIFGKRRSVALRTAGKRKAALCYCVPLPFSVPIAVLVYPILTEAHYHWISCLFPIVAGFVIGAILFDILESRKIERSAVSEYAE
ncbi:MAG: hypothetical protein FWD81_02960 [Methanomassiliicoccaceae archaeon]|nr:hypothetical protein [Methanomassiliicoccaceae archaeon]